MDWDQPNAAIADRNFQIPGWNRVVLLANIKRATVADVPFALGLRFNAPILINKKKQIIAGHGRARLRTTHKANELLTRAGVIADHAEQAAGGQGGSERVHTA